ncbi:hypothetical protein PGT21_022001 [Puccinia graminis f. sp. tritici]|uniref:Uncharacterized protein n=1 Tax=Puccinia graminis f. sp. tritici TaxID=56615 RepID=A0A5B0PYK7_PUCGR|nr:hypothetical protein PGT21_022001 [Puccinia graminis f. sp. tritici]
MITSCRTSWLPPSNANCMPTLSLGAITSQPKFQTNCDVQAAIMTFQSIHKQSRSIPFFDCWTHPRPFWPMHVSHQEMNDSIHI